MFRYTKPSRKLVFCVRIFYFTNLVRAYGDVPYFTEMVTTDQVNSLTRTPAQEIFNAIIAECDKLSTENYLQTIQNLDLDGIARRRTVVFLLCSFRIRSTYTLYAQSII